MVNQKGQEAAPFELLIAVILMGFVIVIGTFAAMELEKQKGEQEINQKLEDFKEALESVSKGKGQYSVNLVLPRYGTDQTLKMKQLSDPFRCSIYCGGSRAVCTIIEFNATGVKSMNKCINISPLTEFEHQFGPPVYCPDRCNADELLFLEDWREESIPQGDYVLTSAYTAAATPVPIICAYRKVLFEDECG